ncbi:hypothetical protein [Thalassobaculum sp.]|uniref:hypothetical protein n=1 Tax=Thalassobaculum sp. TaxID=2022740 RepID=UPI0032EFB1F5
MVVDITKRKELQEWLETASREAAIAISARAALRVVPFCASYAIRELDVRAADYVLPLFRAIAAARAAGTWPASEAELRLAADAAAAAAADAAHSAAYPAAAAAAAADAAAAAADAAVAAVRSDDAVRSAAADAVHSAIRSATAADTVSSATAYMWEAVSDDASAIADGVTPDRLLHRPLWPGRTPTAGGSPWRELTTGLIALDPNWRVWTRWYEDILNGADHPGPRPLIEKLEVARVLIPGADWERGPTHVNALIAELEAQYQPSESIDGPETGRPSTAEADAIVAEIRLRVSETYRAGLTVVFALDAFRRDNEVPIGTDEYDALLALVRDLVERIAQLEAELAASRVDQRAIEVELERLKVQATQGKSLLRIYLESSAKAAGVATVAAGATAIGAVTVSLPLLWDHFGPMVDLFFSQAEALPTPPLSPSDELIDV